MELLVTRYGNQSIGQFGNLGMKLSFDEGADRFILEANDFNTSAGIAEGMRAYLEEIRAKPGKSILIYRDQPTTEALDWTQVSKMGLYDPDGLIRILDGRRIAGVLGSDERYGVGRQIAALSESQGINYRPFRTEAEAMAWLDEETVVSVATRIESTPATNPKPPQNR